MSILAANTHLIKPMSSTTITTNSSLLLSSLPSLNTVSFKPTKLSCTFSLRKKEQKLFVARATTDFNWGSDAVVEEETGGFNDENSVVEAPEEAKIYVGNLSYEVDSASLAGLFEQAGVVDTAEVIYNRETDQSRGFAFVTMATVEEAEKAVEMFSGYELNGRQLTVNKAAPKGARPERTERAPRGAFDGSSRIYVGNLPWSVDDESLEQAFSEYGKVVSARVVSDRETGRSRGFGFVVMSSESETKDAIANLDGQNLDGRSIRVNVAEDKPRQQRRF